MDRGGLRGACGVRRHILGAPDSASLRGARPYFPHGELQPSEPIPVPHTASQGSTGRPRAPPAPPAPASLPPRRPGPRWSPDILIPSAHAVLPTDVPSLPSLCFVTNRTCLPGHGTNLHDAGSLAAQGCAGPASEPPTHSQGPLGWTAGPPRPNAPPPRPRCTHGGLGAWRGPHRRPWPAGIMAATEQGGPTSPWRVGGKFRVALRPESREQT